MSDETTSDVSAGFAAAKRDARIAAVATKAIPDTTLVPTRDIKGNRRSLIPTNFLFAEKTKKRARKNVDAKTQLKLLPDLELCAQILISSVLSPSDMMSADLTYRSGSNIFSSELSSALTDKLKQYFETEYKIEELLPEMLRAIIAEEGSYPVAVIPENVIDYVINQDLYQNNIGMESYNEIKKMTTDDGMLKNLGMLGHYRDSTAKKIRGISFEHYKPFSKPEVVDTRIHYENGKEWLPIDYTHVTDNIHSLMLFKFNHVLRSIRTKNIYSNFGLESENINLLKKNKNLTDKELSDLSIERALNRPRSFITEQLHTLPSQNKMFRKSVGKPMVMKLPSESVLPVHVPGDPKNHIGYFVILDEEGNPVGHRAEDNFYSSAYNGMTGNQNENLGSSLIQRVETNFGLSGDNRYDPRNAKHLDFTAQVYADMVERDLINRVKNGVQSTTVEIASNEDIYRVMFARAMSRKFTQILYIPLDYMTYIALKHDENGVGKSMLDDGSTINSLRSIVMFSDVIANIKNSIGRTKVDIKLDPADPDPSKTIEQSLDEIVRSRMIFFPEGINTQADISSFVQRAGFEFTFSDHPGLPDTKFEIQQTQSSYARPDSDLKDDLKKHSIQLTGLTPEQVDSGLNGEFATTIVANNILLSKRIFTLQNIFTPQLSRHLRLIASYSEELIDDLKKIIDQKKDQIKYDLSESDKLIIENLSEEDKLTYKRNVALSRFLNTFEVNLPKPPSITLENQKSQMDTYIEFVEAAIDKAFISNEILTEDIAGSNLSGKTDLIKAMARAYFVRKYMADKGILPELSELTSTNEDGSPIIDLLMESKNHAQAIVASSVKTLAKAKPIAISADKDLDEAGNVEDTSQATDTPPDNDTPPDGGEFGADNTFDTGNDET